MGGVIIHSIIDSRTGSYSVPLTVSGSVGTMCAVPSTVVLYTMPFTKAAHASRYAMPPGVAARDVQATAQINAAAHAFGGRRCCRRRSEATTTHDWRWWSSCRWCKWRDEQRFNVCAAAQRVRSYPLPASPHNFMFIRYIYQGVYINQQAILCCQYM